MKPNPSGIVRVVYRGLPSARTVIEGGRASPLSPCESATGCCVLPMDGCLPLVNTRRMAQCLTKCGSPMPSQAHTSHSRLGGWPGGARGDPGSSKKSDHTTLADNPIRNTRERTPTTISPPSRTSIFLMGPPVSAARWSRHIWEREWMESQCEEPERWAWPS